MTTFLEQLKQQKFDQTEGVTPQPRFPEVQQQQALLQALERAKIQKFDEANTQSYLNDMARQERESNALQAQKNEIAPIPSTSVIGAVEKLKSVSDTSLIFFFNVHLLVPISLAFRTYSTYPVVNPLHNICAVNALFFSSNDDRTFMTFLSIRYTSNPFSGIFARAVFLTIE